MHEMTVYVAAANYNKHSTIQGNMQKTLSC